MSARMPCGPRWLLRAALGLVLSLAPAAPAGAQELPLLSTEVRLADYDIEGPGDVLRGRVSIAYLPAGPKLSVYFLEASLPTDTPPPPPVQRREPPFDPEAGPHLKALWVWNTRELLDEPDDRGAFLDFVERLGFERIFLQLPPAAGERARDGFVPFDGVRLGGLVAQLRERGALVYALDGDPAYALPENHAGVLRTVRRIVEHNATAPPDQRFHGVRYDIEPYLIPGFQGPRREWILSRFVELLAGIAEITRPAGLALGVDIPFWYDEPDEDSGRPFTAVLNGERAGVLAHLFSLVDDVSIMDYRTRAYGPDGAVRHALGELDAAAERGTSVFVAVETEDLADEELHTFSGQATPGGWLDEIGRTVLLAPLGDGRVRIWLAAGPEARTELEAQLAEAGIAAEAVLSWGAGRAVRIPAERLSFRRLGSARMETEVARIVRRLGGHEAFAGIAYHNYLSLRALLEGSR